MKKLPVILAFGLLLSNLAHAGDIALDLSETETLPCDIQQQEACYKTALKLHYGTEVPKDKPMAHRIWAELCDSNMPDACHAASMFVNKYSADPDYDQYIKFQKMGCELENATSCFLVGRSYESPWGTGGKADHTKAKEYFIRGCELGYNLSCGYAEVEASGYRLKD